jgi:DNA-binding CsgD family transcriptional regulator/PAS domain-containing protein
MSSLHSTDEISALIGQIYDASLDARLWDPFLRSLAQLFDSTQAILLHVDQQGAPQELLATVGLDMDIIGRWNGCKEHVDVWLQQVFHVIPENGTYFSTTLVPQKNLQKSGFHADILRPLDIEHTLGGVPENSPLGRSFMGVYHSSRGRHFTPEQKRVYGLLVPHVHRAIVIKRRLAAEQTAFATAKEAVDRSPYGVVVLDQQGHTLLVNGKAQGILHECDGVTIRYGAIKFHDYGCQTRFDHLVQATGHPNGTGGVSEGGALRVVRPSGKQAYHLLLCPMNSMQEESPLARHGACLVFIHDPTEPKNIPADLLTRIYGLTPAEAHLCATLFKTGSLDAAVAELGITRNTAKTQLSQIFQKSGVSSQSQLLQHVALGLCRPSI